MADPLGIAGVMFTDRANVYNENPGTGIYDVPVPGPNADDSVSCRIATIPRRQPSIIAAGRGELGEERIFLYDADFTGLSEYAQIDVTTGRNAGKYNVVAGTLRAPAMPGTATPDEVIVYRAADVVRASQPA